MRCERGFEDGVSYCLNDHAGCLYNDGHNGCTAGGRARFPLKHDNKIEHEPGCRGRASRVPTIGGYFWGCKRCGSRSKQRVVDR